MNPKVKSLWIRALRSGKYEQAGRFALKMRGQEQGRIVYDALGVLCDLYAQRFKLKWEYDSGKYALLSTWIQLPHAVVIWAELPSGNPCTSQGSLIHLQDDKHLPFSQIADLIEKEF